MTSVLLADPDTYAAGPPHAAIAEMRAAAPVQWESQGPDGFWSVLGHAEVVEVSRDPARFSAEVGGVVLDTLPPPQLEMMRQMLLAMDPPRHHDYRAPMADQFRPRVIAALEGQVREIVRDAIDVPPGEVEFVHDVCAAVPSRVVAKLMGIPAADVGRLHHLAEVMATGQTEDLVDGDSPAGSASIEMAMYAIEFAAARRAAPPQEDLTTLVLGTDFGGSPMTDIDFGSFFVQLVTAGNDTTRTMLSSGLHALATHPDALAEVRADRSLLPGAVEEILRWANPLHYFRRTATLDTTLGGCTIAAGDRVVMWYTAANRDPRVFADPHRFDIHRSPNPHLSFGIGEHFCLGVHLARLEGRVFFDELLTRFADIELAGDPTRTPSNLNNGYASMPVRLG